MKALIVDDEKIILDFLVRYLKVEDIEAKVAEDGQKAIALAQEESFDLIFIDVRMPRMDGVQVLKELKKTIPDTQRYIMMTGYAVENLLEEAKQEGVALSIRKPFDMQELGNLIAKFSKKGQG